MAFRRDPTSQLIFESKLVPGSSPGLPDDYMTRIVLERDGKSILHVGAFRTGTGDTFTITCQPAPLFTIRFDKFNLPKYTFDLPDNNSKPFRLEYFGGTPHVLSQPGDPELRIKYTDVPPSPLQSYDNIGYDRIEVEVALREAAEPGWIEFDIAYNWPSQMLMKPGEEAWSPTLIYPILRLDQSSVREHLLLNSQGLLGKLTDLSVGTPSCTMPIQFAAIYYANYSFYGEHFANGLAISADDEVGSYKELHYSNDLTPGAPPTTSVSTHLRQPIHLKNKQYVLPYHGDYGSPNYRLSYKGTDGFGGAGMRYRLRAFHIEKPVNGGPVDWHDVAELYRTLAKKRAFYYKYNYQQRRGGHIDLMNPHTIVCNYGLDGPIDPGDGDQRLRNALELHPMVARPATDMPNNGNEPLPELLKRLRARFTLREPFQLEAQIWGFEMGGFYRFIGGYPPMTNVLAQDNSKFRQALAGLASAGILASVTTDVLSTNFVRKRFRGHLKQEGTTWKPFITQPFPKLMTEFTQGALRSCAYTTDSTSNRLIYVDGCPETTILRNNWRVGPGVNPLPFRLITFDPNKGPFDLQSRFYAIQSNRICPTKEVEDLYINGWLIKHLFSESSLTNNGVKLLEFMKHRDNSYFCFDRDHEHIHPRPADKPYDNAIGFGSWYINRMRSIFQRVHDEGLKRSGKDFTLTTEFVPPEVLAPFVDDYYEYDSSTIQVYFGDTRSLQVLPYLKPVPVLRRVPLFQFVYNPLVGQKMNLAESDWAVHAGYKETRNSTPLDLSALRPDKDTAPLPPPVNADPNDQNARRASFAAWQKESIEDFSRCYTVADTGLSPQNYPTTTGSYSYRRGIQDIFNLRSRIFRFGAAAVRGERILLPAAWIEQPYEYNEEAIRMAVRAAQLQTVYKPFFRGDMMGQTDVDPSASVWAWRAGIRGFADFLELVKNVGYTDTEIFGDPLLPAKQTTLPIGLSVSDAISRGFDIYETVPVGAAFWVFRLGDLIDPIGFLLRLRAAQDAVSQYLKSRFSPDLQEKVNKYDGSNPSPELQESLFDGLNPLLVDPSLFNEQRFAQVQLRALTRLLLARKPQGQNLLPLNRMLIEDAYPQIVKRAFLTSTTLVTDKVQHMIWRWTVSAADLRYLYAFANVGNSPQQIRFNYTRGIEGADPWVSIRRDFVGDPAANRGGIVGNAEPIKFGQMVTVTIPERSIIAYGILKQKFLPPA
jgi:hypothetical protein